MTRSLVVFFFLCAELGSWEVLNGTMTGVEPPPSDKVFMTSGNMRIALALEGPGGQLLDSCIFVLDLGALIFHPIAPLLHLGTFFSYLFLAA